MSDPAELDLVVKAIKSGLDGCVEWDVKVVNRLRQQLAPFSLKLIDIRSDLIRHVRAGGEVVQHKEDREEWKDRRDFWYHVVVPTPLFRKGLFVKLELRNSDPELPEVNLVQAHEEL